MDIILSPSRLFARPFFPEKGTVQPSFSGSLPKLAAQKPDQVFFSGKTVQPPSAEDVELAARIEAHLDRTSNELRFLDEQAIEARREIEVSSIQFLSSDELMAKLIRKGLQKNENPRIRRQCAFTIGKLKSDDFKIPLMEEVFRDEDWQVRDHGVYSALKSLESDVPKERFLWMIVKDANKHVRAGGAVFIGDLKDDTRKPDLVLEIVKDPSFKAREGLCTTMRSIQDATVRHDLSERLMAALPSLEKPDDVRKMAKALLIENSRVRKAAFNAIETKIYNDYWG